MLYNPANHYWLVAGNGAQAYSTAAVAYVDVTDATYEGWLAAGNYPTKIDSEASLRDVLAEQYPAGWPLDLATYANLKQLEVMTGGFTMTLSGTTVTFATDPQSQVDIGFKYARLGAPNPPTTIDWEFATGYVLLSATDLATAAPAIADFVQATYDAKKVVLAAISAGTITTAAQVDAAAWPANHA